MTETIEKAARLAAAELGLGDITVEWFDGDAPPGAPGKLLGAVWAHHPQTIHIKAGRPESSTLDTVAHEVRHLWQLKHGYISRLKMLSTAESYFDGEADAESYAREFVQRFYAGRAGSLVSKPFVKGASQMTAFAKEARKLLGVCK